ncbi:MAG: LeuA family protein [Candidatus Levybacteria bacterium]|nr:LeuA family protein [Candidatus Levybacteria bacterium]
MKKSLIYRWDDKLSKRIDKQIELNDETLRDGLQATYVKHPNLKEKIQFLEASDKMGINSINLGFPVSGENEKKEIIALANHAKKKKLNIRLECGGRILRRDVQAIIDVSQKTGIGIEAGLFIASSKIRHIVEEWDLRSMGKMIKDNVSFAVKNNLPVMFVTEDTTRSHPQTISYLYNKAIDAGATRICICDTVGAATPSSTYNLVSYVKKEIIKNDKKIKIDWHGHNDRGLATANSLAAVAAGADCIQAAALGVGERTGNTVMEELILNLHMEGLTEAKLDYLAAYTKTASKILNVNIRPNAPVIGKDIFKTATGVHAAAIKKAFEQKNEFLAGNVYTSINPALIGRKHDILVGPVSGKANVEWFLKKINIAPNSKLIELILGKAKMEKKILSERDILKIVKLLN